MLPNFLGVGAARAGTTWIARNLAEHPDVFLPRKKELHFFDRHFQDGVPVYEAEFEGWSGQSAIGEITPQYFHNEVVATRIKELVPSVKLLFCLRNPIDRAYSHYWKSKASFPDPTNATFEEKLDTLPEIINVGYYFDHLQRYIMLFPGEQIHILLFDELEEQPGKVLREMYSFLNVDPTFTPALMNQKINAGASQGNLGKSKLLWYLYRLFNRAGVHQVAKSLEKANTQELPPMLPETRQKLAKIYRDQVRQLEDLIKRDLSCWGIA
jgi:hypothetical protein